MNRATPPDDTRFRLLVESIGDVLWFRELEPDRFSYVSPAFERMHGLGGIGGFAADHEIVLEIDESGQSGAEDGMIIDNEHPLFG